jgi:hypothetical protein
VAVIEFEPWPKTPRLYRNVTITEKIDGTNAAVIVKEFPYGTHVDGVPANAKLVLGPGKMDNDGLPAFEYLVAAQSRRRIITPGNDNHGFAGWVWENAEYLARTLEEGHHYGEWWGVGIQRGYNMSKRVFSLFNLRRWGHIEFDNDQLRTVPIVFSGPFSDVAVENALARLEYDGSLAAPGYDRPEGVCVFHEDSNQVFKVALTNDHLSKSAAGNTVDTADWFAPFEVAA